MKGVLLTCFGEKMLLQFQYHRRKKGISQAFLRKLLLKLQMKKKTFAATLLLTFLPKCTVFTLIITVHQMTIWKHDSVTGDLQRIITWLCSFCLTAALMMVHTQNQSHCSAPDRRQTQRPSGEHSAAVEPDIPLRSRQTKNKAKSLLKSIINNTHSWFYWCYSLARWHLLTHMNDEWWSEEKVMVYEWHNCRSLNTFQVMNCF